MFLFVVCCVVGFTIGLSACSAGEDGRGITATTVNDKGELVITFSDGTSENLGKITGENGLNGEDGATGEAGVAGKDGKGIVSAVVNEKGELIVTYTDGSEVNVGKVKGENGQNGSDGQNGQDGQDGQDGKDGVGIASIVVNEEGKMVITYTDDTTVTLDIPSVSQICKHEKDEFLIIEEHSEGKLGVYLYVCPDCGRSKVVRDNKHHYEDTVIEPTCTEGGYTARICSDCNDTIQRTNETAALGHDYSDAYTVVEEGKTICEHGGMTVKICDRCGDVIVTTIEKTGHKSSAWVVANNPTMEAEGNLEGTCDNCGKFVTYQLPSFASDMEEQNKFYDYKITQEKQSCTEIGKATYTCVVDGQTFSFEVNLEAHEHYLEGTAASTSAASKEFDGKIYYNSEATGIKEFPDDGATCTTFGKGYFECSECGELVYVDTYKNHSVAEDGWTVTSPASCTANGEKTGNCSVCGEVVTEVIDKLTHAYIPSISQDASKKYTITLTCSSCQDSYVLAEGLDTVDYTDDSERSCQHDTIRTYTYTKDGVTYNMEVTLSKLNHAINGTDATTLHKDGYYSVYLEGIKEFPDNKASCEDGSHGKGYFKCSICGDLIYVDTYMPHQYTDYVVEEEPTCTTPGSSSGTCSVCGDSTPGVIPALGHEYSYEIEEQEGGTYNIIKVCTRTGCGDRLTVTENVELGEPDHIIEASCTGKGIDRYTIEYTPEGGDEKVYLTFDVEVAQLSHFIREVSADEYVEEDGSYNVKIEGIKEFPDNQATCMVHGKGYYECSACGEMIYVDTCKDHTYTEASEDIKPTCTTDGKLVYTCEVEGCGKTVEKIIPATGHTYQISEVVNPTEEVAGSATIKCHCGDTQSIVLPALTDENYSEEAGTKKVLVEVSCKQEGVIEYTYTDETYNITITFKVVSAIGSHTNADEDGAMYTWTVGNICYKGYICSGCNQVIVVSATEIPVEEAAAKVA